MACYKSLLTILFLVLPPTCSSIRGASKFKNHTASSVASSTTTGKDATSASSAAALQYNQTLANDTHRMESSLQSGSVSSLATAMNLKGNASSSSETTVQRNDQVVQGDDSLTASIKHAISHSTTQILKGHEKGMVGGNHPEMPSAMTFCEYPSKCLAGALAPSSSKSLKTVVIADAQSVPQVPRKWRPPSSRLWVFCVDPDYCEQDYGFPSYEDSDEYYDYAEQTASLRSWREPDQHGMRPRVPGFIVRGKDLSRAIERRGLTQEYHNTLQQLNSNTYYRRINFPTKVLLAKMLTLSKDERIGFAIKCLLQKLADHIDKKYDLARKRRSPRVQQSHN